MKYRKLFRVSIILFMLCALFTIVTVAIAQDSTAVNPSGVDFFPPWLVTILSFLTTGIAGSYLSSQLIQKHLYKPKLRFLFTWLTVIILGVGAAFLAGKSLSNYPEFISYTVNAATAAYVLWIKKRS